jgi:hypothetical protein
MDHFLQADSSRDLSARRPTGSLPNPPTVRELSRSGSNRNIARVEDPICIVAGLTISMTTLVLRMVRVPGSDGGSDDDGVFVRSHGVLYVRWNEQEATNGVRLEVLKVERFAEADLQYALNNCDPGVGGMRVEVMEPLRNESRVRECFACHVAPAFEHRPLRSSRIDFLPHNCFRVPCERHFGWFGDRSC